MSSHGPYNDHLSIAFFFNNKIDAYLTLVRRTHVK